MPLRRITVLLAALLLVSGLGQGFVHNQRANGALLVRSDFAGIHYKLNNATAAGMTNNAGAVVITSSSAPVEAVIAALAGWTIVPDSTIQFSPLEITSADSPEAGNGLLITFADTAINRAVVGGAVAVTLICSDANGVIQDSDIVFNPTLTYSTTGTAQTYDVQGTLTHELGHAIGLDHSTVAGSTMLAFTATGTNALASLEQDDQLFAQHVYPRAGAAPAGRITGRITSGAGLAARRAVVTAHDLERNVVVGAIAKSDGQYELPRVPPGRYAISAEPMDGPVRSSQLGPAGFLPDTNFLTGYFGGGPEATVEVRAGASVAADITVQAGSPTLNLLGVGAAAQGGVVFTFTSARLRPGQSHTIEAYGDGLDSPALTEASARLLGTGVSIAAGSFRPSTLELTTGETFPTVLLDVLVAADAPPGLATLELSANGERTLYTGGLLIEPRSDLPSFESNAVVSGASFIHGALAPGGIATVFGLALGPEAGVSGGTQPVSGGIVRLLGGVQVLVGGVPAPLFFANSGQVNFQAPFEIAGQTEVAIRVLRDQRPSAFAAVAVREADPALFLWPGASRAIAIAASGQLIEPGRPARRGETIIVFGTGQGLLDNPVGTGLFATASPLSRAALPVRVRFGADAEAQVAFAGLTPGFAGLLQLNLVVPPASPTGPAIPLNLQAGAIVSQQAATLPVE